MVEANIVLTLLQTISIMVGIGYYILNIQNNQKNQIISLKNQELTLESQKQATETRRAQLYMQVFNMSMNNRTFMDSYFKLLTRKWNDYDDFVESCGILKSEFTELGNELIHVTSVFEGVGVLVKEKMLDIHLIAVLMSAMTRMLWEKIQPFVVIHRKTVNLPRWISEYEYLYNELMKYHEEHPELAT